MEPSETFHILMYLSNLSNLLSASDTSSGKESLSFVGMCHCVLRQLPEGTQKQIALSEIDVRYYLEQLLTELSLDTVVVRYPR
jgi:hypothetical protein